MNVLYDALIAPFVDRKTPFLKTDDQGHISHGDFVVRAAQMAQVLRRFGVGADDRVLVQAPKTPDMLALYAGCLQAGAVFLPLNPAYTVQELSYFIADAAPAAIICAEQDAGPIRLAAGANPPPILTLNADGSGTLAASAHGAPGHFDTVPRGPDDLAGLLYTSGTTGRSKGAMMTHRNLLSNAQSLTRLWQMTKDDCLIHALPIFHTHGLFVAMNTALLAGASVRFMHRFDPDQVIAALPRATLMMGVPTFYTRLLDDDRLDRKLCKNMRLFISGSAPLLAETHQAFAARTGHRILERYGMTETNMITSNPYEGDRIAGSVGYALPGVAVRITKDARPLPPGEVGMIEVRGENVFRGYWRMPEKTAAEFRPDGYFITGDLGTMDTDGRVTIVGREKDLIISGGYNIYPKEVEDVLNAVDGVAESAVFGIPHGDLGEQVVAAIVADDKDLKEADLQDSVGQALARFKHPRRYIMLPALPRNTMGKVQKVQLRAQYGGG